MESNSPVLPTFPTPPRGVRVDATFYERACAKREERAEIARRWRKAPLWRRIAIAIFPSLM